MKNFWNKAESNDEIFIYGDIVGENFFDSDVTAKKFAEDLNSCGENVTIHINSNGGDCFTALAIANLISQSPKNITVSIDGICASAATIISGAAKKVCMAENALMMIHLPSCFLAGMYDAVELAKIESALNKVRDSILLTYENKTGLEILFLTKLMNEETWLTAQEAKDLYFVDEITGAIDLKIDDSQNLLIMNSLKLNKNYYSKAKEKLKMDNSILEKIKNLLKGEKLPDAKENFEIENEIRAKELDRILALNQERCGNAAVNAIIDVAISEGKNFSDVENYISAVKSLPPENNVAEQILNLIEDNLNSGAKDVTASDGDFSTQKGEQSEKQKVQAELIAKFLK